MWSKVIFGHPKWPPTAILWQNFQKKKSCVLIWHGEKCDRKWFSVIQTGSRGQFCFKKRKFGIDLKWREMWSKVIFGHPKYFLKQIKVAYWSEMVRNAIKSDFRSSIMATGGHLWINLKQIKVAYWSEITYMQVKNETVAICPGCLLELTGLLSIWSVLGSIRYPLNEYKSSTKILTDCRHYPGGIKMPSL